MEHIAVLTSQKIDVILREFERRFLELYVSWTLAENKAEVDMYDVPRRVN